MALTVDPAPQGLHGRCRAFLAAAARQDAVLAGIVAGEGVAEDPAGARRRRPGPALTRPISVYTLSLAAAKRREGLSTAAVPSGWRVLLLDPLRRPIRCIDVAVAAEGETEQMSLAGGDAVVSLYAAISRSDTRFAGASQPLRLRCVEAPALLLSALWVVGDGNWLMPYGGRFGADAELDNAGFSDLAYTAAVSARPRRADAGRVDHRL